MRRWFVALAALVALSPSLVRLLGGEPLLAGSEPYLIATVLEGMGIPRAVSAWLVVGAAVLCLSVSVLLAVQALRKARLSQFQADATVVFLILSPAFITAATITPSSSLALLALAFGSRALQSRTILRWGGYGSLIVALGVLLWQTLRLPLGFSQTIVDLGAATGYGLFALLAAIVGGTVLWKNKARYYFLTLGALALVIASFAVPALVLPGTLAISVFGGLGFVRLYRRRWVFTLIRTLSIALFICGVLFSAVTSFSSIVRSAPSAELASGLSEIRFSLPDGPALSHPEMGQWVSYWGGRAPAVLDASALDSVWHSRNLANTTAILSDAGVGSIIITTEMRQGKVWAAPDDGLLFLLENSRAFRQVSRGIMVEGWQYLPQELNASEY